MSEKKNAVGLIGGTLGIIAGFLLIGKALLVGLLVIGIGAGIVWLLNRKWKKN